MTLIYCGEVNISSFRAVWLLCTSKKAAKDTLLLHSANNYRPGGIFIALLMVTHFFLEQYVEKGMEKEKPAGIDDPSALLVSGAKD